MAKPVAQFAVAQAVFVQEVIEEINCVAQSPDFAEDWIPMVRSLLQQFAVPLDTKRFDTIVFARPLNKQQIVIVQVGDLRIGSPLHTSRDGIGFHVFILPKKKYIHFLGDPFVVVERMEPAWDAEGALPLLTWPEEPLPPRKVAQVQEVLKRIKHAALIEDVPGEEQIEEAPDPTKHTESPALLGGVQLLVDGGRLVFERPQPDKSLVQAMWTLLPQTSRIGLWPATYAFNDHIPFDMMVVARYVPEDYPGYTTEDQAADYPEGSYELSLQIAAELGDQDALDSLYYRRSPQETLKMGIILLVSIILILWISSLFQPPQIPDYTEPSKIATGLVGMNHPLNAATYSVVAREEYNKHVRKTHP